jgi:hypothetical protein
MAGSVKTGRDITGRDIYASQLIESLSDVIDTLNEALADELMFDFEISTAKGQFVLTSLTCTKNVMPKEPVDAN